MNGVEFLGWSAAMVYAGYCVGRLAESRRRHTADTQARREREAREMLRRALATRPARPRAADLLAPPTTRGDAPRPGERDNGHLTICPNCSKVCTLTYCPNCQHSTR